MADVVKEKFLNRDIREPTTYRTFPDEEYERILSAVKSVPNSVVANNPKAIDGLVAESLSDYEFEQDSEVGLNPECKLWAPEFDHSVDLYHSEKRIAIEIEKTQMKRMTDCLLKFMKGGNTYPDDRKQIEFGCLVVPTNYGSRNDNLVEEAMRWMRFTQDVLDVEDIAVIGYREPDSQ